MGKVNAGLVASPRTTSGLEMKQALFHSSRGHAGQQVLLMLLSVELQRCEMWKCRVSGPQCQGCISRETLEMWMLPSSQMEANDNEFNTTVGKLTHSNGIQIST